MLHGSQAFQRTERAINAPGSRYYAHGKFGRLFPALPRLSCPGVEEPQLRNLLLELGKQGGPMDPTGGDNPVLRGVPPALVFYGQFIDHDITFDPTSTFERQNDPEMIANFRTPALELDNVYASGPDATPYLYGAGDRKSYLVTEKLAGAGSRDDLPRVAGTLKALIGDPRNDENLVVSRVQLAFLKFHNAVLERQANGDFERALRLVRWHHQWIVLHEFLPAMIGRSLLKEIYQPGLPLGRGRLVYHWRNEPFIPVEFSVAAYRFGHTLIPETLRVNDEFKIGSSFDIPLFVPRPKNPADPDDLSGGARAKRRYVDWQRLITTTGPDAQFARQVNTKIAPPLFKLPASVVPQEGDERLLSLAARNLLRGHSFGLPDGQSVARAMCETPLSPEEIDFGDEANNKQFECFRHHTPLWYYILREAEVRAGGQHLGRVGGRIVGEVLVGLLEGDNHSFVSADPLWEPELPPGRDFRLRDLLAFAGELPAPAPLRSGR